MRLLNTNTFELSHLFVPHEVPDYVILSHRWRDGEVTFGDISKCPLSGDRSPTRKMKGFLKIQGACQLAQNDGYDWIWIDSCCIDKSSSAELQESINSMWRYYSEANYCYVYMDDVPNAQANCGDQFHCSEWFKRAWTLQELIAPKFVEFYAANWQLIGTKLAMCDRISEITHVAQDALKHTRHTRLFNAAEKLSWASHRLATREEDESYSLLGLFGINMPLLYGEGRQKAFVRLQEAIYHETSDGSLFFFRSTLSGHDCPLMADSPGCFCSKPECSYLYPNQTHCSWYILHSLPQWTPRLELIVSEYFWTRQIHNQVMVKRSQDRLFASIELQVLDFQDISHLIIYLDGHIPARGVDQVAILEYTLDTYRHGALCMLLRKNRDKLSHSFYRAAQQIALISDIRQLSLLPTKATIVSPVHEVLQTNSSSPHVWTQLEARSLNYHLEGWGTREIRLISTEDERCLEFWNDGGPAYFDRAYIECYVHKVDQALSKLRVRIVYKNGEWRVEKVSTAVYDKVQLALQADIACCDPNHYGMGNLFVDVYDDGSESTDSDRYIFSDDDHGVLEMKVRRGPSSPATSNSAWLTHRYELVIDQIQHKKE